MMKSSKVRIRQTIYGLGIAIGIIIVVLYVLFPVGMGIAAIIPAQSAVGNPPEGFEEITLITDDGIQLEGWYSPPQNGMAIILLHGSGGSRESVRSYIDILTGNGYGVLALDQRGHGESGGKTGRLGWEGTSDVGAAVAFLENQPEVKHIGGLGISMGGEVLLGAASTYPQIEMIVTDGATRRSLNELLALESERPLVRNYTARVMFATVQVIDGIKPPSPLLESIKEAETTRFLFIAAGNNEMEVAFNRMFKEILGSRADLWIAPNSEHTTAVQDYPEEYEKVITSFFSLDL
jgi:pimeloyl-ACP methyl ester carboxylesterase